MVPPQCQFAVTHHHHLVYVKSSFSDHERCWCILLLVTLHLLWLPLNGFTMALGLLLSLYTRVSQPFLSMAIIVFLYVSIAIYYTSTLVALSHLQHDLLRYFSI